MAAINTAAYAPIFTTGAANTVAHGVVWIKSKIHAQSIIAYGLSNLIAIVDERSSCIICTLKGHSGKVKSLAFCELVENKCLLFSAGEDYEVRVWQHDYRQPPSEWSQVAQLSGSKSSIVALSCLAAAGEENGVIAAASDSMGLITVWSSCYISANEGEEKEGSLKWTRVCATTLPPSQMAHCLHLTELPLGVDTNGAAGALSGGISQPSSVAVALLVGGVDAKIHIYLPAQPTGQTSSSLFFAVHSDCSTSSSTTTAAASSVLSMSCVATLTGHEEWVTCLSSTMMNDKKCLMLASGSQDSKIRVWKFKAAVAVADSSESNVAIENQGDNEADDDNVDDGGENVDDGEAAASAPVFDEDDMTEEARAIFIVRTTRGVAMEVSVYLESLLLGHEDWITSVSWLPGVAKRPLQLFSTSMDRNMIIWAPDVIETIVEEGVGGGSGIGINASAITAGSGVWMPLVRVGDMGGSLGGSIGGNLLGFVGGCTSPEGLALLGIGYGGSFHLWEAAAAASSSFSSLPPPPAAFAADASVVAAKRTNAEETLLLSALDSVRWVPRPFITGHFGAVTDACWSVDDRASFLVTVSSDQTCRVFAPVLLASSSSSSSNNISSCWQNWREVSRPQIHGYDLNAVTIVANKVTAAATENSVHNCTLLTGGEEKLIRCFEPPQIVLRGLSELCGVPPPLCSSFSSFSSSAHADAHAAHADADAEKRACDSSSSSSSSSNDSTSNSSRSGNDKARIERAYMPELGLSNKAYDTMSTDELKEQAARGVITLDWSRPPLEGQLADFTLWPETEKLFGHNNEVLCVAASVCGRFLASASKAREATAAHTLVWYRPSLANGKFELAAKLPGHESTVVSVKFSPSGRYLATAGKDRAICLYTIDDNRTSSSSSSSSVASAATFTLVARVKSAHKRIIWDSCWSADSSHLITTSRDGAVKIWKVQTPLAEVGAATAAAAGDSGNGAFDLVTVQTLSPFGGTAVTATDILTLSQDLNSNNKLTKLILMALGSEHGNIQVWTMGSDFTTAELLLNVPQEHAHGMSVRKLRWRPITSHTPAAAAAAAPGVVNGCSGSSNSTSSLHELASIGDDNCVRLHNIQYGQ